MLTQYVNGDPEDEEDKKICKTMNNYVLGFEKETDLVKTFYNGLNNKKNWKSKSLKIQVFERYAQTNACKLTIEDYNKLNELLNSQKYKPSEELLCDMIRPALPVFNENTTRCKSFGKYLLQFGPDVYKKFHEMSDEKWTKRNKGIVKKKSISNTIVQKAIRLEKHTIVKPFSNNAAIVVLNNHYRKNCLDIFEDYNTFYDAYMKLQKDNNTDGKKTLEAQTKNKCDFFVHLKLDQH